MPTTTARRRPGYRLSLVLVLTLLLAVFVRSTRSEADPAQVICADPGKPETCYPLHFQPTHEFQPIKPGQEIPPGLHVRLNMQTGEKEAKINVPDEVDPSLEGLPVDRGVVVVDDPAEARGDPQIPRGAPVYENVGKIKPPTKDSGWINEYLTAIQHNLPPSESWFDDALEQLEDVSHDIYYGLKIAEDTHSMGSLLCLMADKNVPSVNGSMPRDQRAALIIGGALQNNHAALQEFSASFEHTLREPCSEHLDKPLRESLWESLAPSEFLSPEMNSAKIKAKISAVNGMIKDEAVMKDFMHKNGMGYLLKVLLEEGPEWEGAQRKAGQLVLDNFLDQDMGARLGVWPDAARLSDTECKTGEKKTLDSGCWDYHVERIARAHKKERDHWSRDLEARLKAARKRGGGQRQAQHDEL